VPEDNTIYTGATAYEDTHHEVDSPGVGQEVEGGGIFVNVDKISIMGKRV
jgi:hypothetical protein